MGKPPDGPETARLPRVYLQWWGRTRDMQAPCRRHTPFTRASAAESRGGWTAAAGPPATGCGPLRAGALERAPARSGAIRPPSGPEAGRRISAVPQQRCGLVRSDSPCHHGPPSAEG
ncbi:hypothetical protein GCM10027440_00420 [Nocardiopsis coralliicola]